MLAQKDLEVNLGFKVYSLIFGDSAVNRTILEDLRPFHKKVDTEIHPFDHEEEHKKGNFKIIYNLHVFPIEFRSDFHEHYSSE